MKANFKKIRPNKYEYKSLETSTTFEIIINDPNCHGLCFCSCKGFMKAGVCCHVIGLSNTHGLDLYTCKYSKPASIHERF